MWTFKATIIAMKVALSHWNIPVQIVWEGDVNPSKLCGLPLKFPRWPTSENLGKFHESLGYTEGAWRLVLGPW
jgi:hypothetical protein